MTRNHRGPCLIEAFGEARTIAGWAKVSGFSVRALRARHRRLRGLPGEVMLSLSRDSKAHVDTSAPPGAPGSWTWDIVPWEDDVWARAWVARHPGGATLDEVGLAMGVSYEDVRLIVESALLKLEKEVATSGLPFAELLGIGSDGGDTP